MSLPSPGLWLLGAGALLVMAVRACLVSCGPEQTVVLGRRGAAPSGRLRRVASRRAFRWPLLEAVHRLELPLNVELLVPYARCRDGVPLSLDARVRVGLHTDPAVLEGGLPRLVRRSRADLRAGLAARVDRAVRRVFARVTAAEVRRARAVVARRVAAGLRDELVELALDVESIALCSLTDRPLGGRPSTRLIRRDRVARALAAVAPATTTTGASFSVTTNAGRSRRCSS